MTTEVALGLIWIATMIALGLAVERGNHWKKRHDFDHELMTRLDRLLTTTTPTEETFALMKKMNEDDFPIKMVARKDVLP